MAIVFSGFKRIRTVAFLIIFLLFPLLLQLLVFHFEWVGPKYIFHLLPLFLTLSAFGIFELVNRLKITEHIGASQNINLRFYTIILSLFLILAGASHAYFETHQGKLASPYWRSACEYTLFNSENEIVIVTSVYLIPHFYLNSEEYGLRYENKEYKNMNITIYDRPHLHTKEDLENITQIHDKGWVLIDMDRWNFEAVITESARQYLRDNMTFHHYDYQIYLFIYSWGYD
jgi:hypothetical protein